MQVCNSNTGAKNIMTFEETGIDGCFIFRYTKDEDIRGDFSRLICKNNLAEMGIDFDVKQSSLAFNKHKNTARGLHYQKEPHGENKIITCVSGRMDVFVLDLRDFKTIVTKRLDSSVSSRELIYVPKYCASGYITLEDNSYVLYFMDEYYHPESQEVVSLLREGIDIDLTGKDVIALERDI